MLVPLLFLIAIVAIVVWLHRLNSEFDEVMRDLYDS